MLTLRSLIFKKENFKTQARKTGEVKTLRGVNIDLLENGISYPKKKMVPTIHFPLQPFFILH
jgi:hypothetical protein